MVAFPYWVDTRLVGMNAGEPTRDMAIWPESFADTLDDPRAKLFLIKPEDTADLELLQQLYPLGSLSLYNSDIPDRDFYHLSCPAWPATGCTARVSSLPRNRPGRTVMEQDHGNFYGQFLRHPFFQPRPPDDSRSGLAL